MALTQPQQARRLTADEEAALVRDYNHTRDPRKLAQLVSSCTPLVKAYARRTWRRNSRIDLDDLPFSDNDANSEELGEPVQAELPSGALELVEGGANGASKSWPYSLDAVIREASKLALIRALQATEGNCHRAAELLGVSRYTVYRMLNRFGLAEGRSYRTFRKPTVRRA